MRIEAATDFRSMFSELYIFVSGESLSSPISRKDECAQSMTRLNPGLPWFCASQNAFSAAQNPLCRTGEAQTYWIDPGSGVKVVEHSPILGRLFFIKG